MSLRPSVRALATLAVAGLLAATASAGAATASTDTARIDPAGIDNVAPDGRVIAGLSVQVAGELPATASAQTPYGLMIEAISTLRDVNNVSVSLAVTSEPFADVAALTAFVESPASMPLRTVATTPVANATTELGQTSAAGHLTAGARSTTMLLVPPGGLGLRAASPGVYGIVVTVSVEGESVWTRAAPLTWQPDSLPKLAVTPVVSVTGEQARVDALLNAASDPRVALLVDPTALTGEQQLTLSDREVYSLPADNIDITSVAHASSVALIDAAVARTRSASSLRWIAIAAAADGSTVAAATASGAAAILVDARWSTLPAPSGGGAYDAGVIDGVVTVPVLIADAPLSSMLASLSPADSTSTAWVVAQAAFEASAGAGSVIVAPGDGWGVEGTRPSRALTALLDASFVVPQTLEQVLAAPAREAIELPAEADTASDAHPEDVIGAVSALTRLDVLASATTAPSTMIADASSGLLASLSLANRVDPVYRGEQINAARDSASAVLSTVSVTSGSELLLVSSSGSVPITVTNKLDVPVTVRVSMTSRSPILRTREQATATIESGADVTVKVPVKAISSGDVGVSVALRSEDGATIAVAETLKVRVRAAWGNLATGVFTAGLVVLLIAGVVRTARRGRKDTRLRPTPDTAVAGASSDGA